MRGDGVDAGLQVGAVPLSALSIMLDRQRALGGGDVRQGDAAGPARA